MEENKEEEILKMLTDGQPYAVIQETLGVSSKTISKVKKDNFPVESNNDVLSGSTFGENPDETNQDFPIKTQSQSQGQEPNSKNNQIMECETVTKQKTESRSQEEIELEKYKIKTQYDLERAKLENDWEISERKDAIRKEELRIQNLNLELAREKIAADLKREEMAAENHRFDAEQNRIAFIRKEELRIENERIANERKKLEEIRLALLKQFNSLLEECAEGEWNYQEAEEYLKRVIGLRERMNQGYQTADDGLCFLEHMRLLDKIANVFKELLPELDDDYSEIEFSEEFNELLENWETDMMHVT